MKNEMKLMAGVLVACIFLNSASSSMLDMKRPDTNLLGANYNFKYTGVLNVGNETMPLIGQLSKDGRNLYFTSQSRNGSKQLFKMERTHLGDNFSAPEKLEGAVNDGSYDVIMPSVTADEKTMVFVSSASGMQNGNDLYIATKDANGKFTSVRNLEEINDPNISDSYPWLSPSGLRVYFTKQRGANITFFVAERKTLNDKFNNLRELGFKLPKVNNNMSCFLTNNELEIYALSGEKIYHATRKTTNDTFEAPVEIAKTGSDGFMSGITMTDDAKELYVFNSVGFRNTQILRFINNGMEQKMPQVSPGK